MSHGHPIHTYHHHDEAQATAPHTLIMTVGLPRCGKSTWARGTGYPIVNPDSIRLALHGTEFIPEAEDMVWVIARYMVKSLFLAGHSVVVLDATNLTKARRAMWTRHYKTVMVPFDTPKEVCIERALALGQEGLVPIIESMAKNTDPLGPEDCVMSPISFDSALVADIVCVGGSRP